MTDPTLASFMALDEQAWSVVDRSDLERYATCPAQARHYESGEVNTHAAIATAGAEAHRAFSEAITTYLSEQGNLSPSQLKQEVDSGLVSSRPDVQPEAIRGARASVYDWSTYIHALHPENILRYDGGTGDRSGQLAWDLDDLRVRVTSELDLLHAGPSTKCLHERDYKTGHKHWTAAMVRDAFQFTLHAVLVFRNYPEVDGLEIAIWNTRSNQLAWPVEFGRYELPKLEARVRSAAGEYVKWHDANREDVPTWPEKEKCKQCDAAWNCRASGGYVSFTLTDRLIATDDERDIKENPAAYVKRMFAASRLLDRMLKVAGAYVDETGQDIRTEDGEAFGTGKPKQNRKPPMTLYQLKQEDES